MKGMLKDMLRTEIVAAGIIATKPLRDILPEPFDIGMHTGNAGMTMAALAVPLLCLRAWQERPGNMHAERTSPQRLAKLRRKMIIAAAVSSLALNVWAEQNTNVYGQELQNLLRTDWIDVVYGVGGGLIAAELMSRGLKNKGGVSNNTVPRQSENATSINVHKREKKRKRAKH